MYALLSFEIVKSPNETNVAAALSALLTGRSFVKLLSNQFVVGLGAWAEFDALQLGLQGINGQFPNGLRWVCVECAPGTSTLVFQHDGLTPAERTLLKQIVGIP